MVESLLVAYIVGQVITGPNEITTNYLNEDNQVVTVIEPIQQVDKASHWCYCRFTSGGEASRSKHFTQTVYFFEFIMFNFTSSAIESISDVQDGKVTVTFNGGREYTYAVPNVDQFVSELTSVINAQGSVGRFVNTAIKSEQLVAAW